MKNNQDTAQTPKELFAELQSLVGEAETMMADSVSEHTADAIEALRERFYIAQERLSALCSTAKLKIAAGARQTDAAIRANPYQALAIAAGVGLLAGVLLGRRSK